MKCRIKQRRKCCRKIGKFKPKKGFGIIWCTSESTSELGVEQCGTVNYCQLPAFSYSRLSSIVNERNETVVGREHGVHIKCRSGRLLWQFLASLPFGAYPPLYLRPTCIISVITPCYCWLAKPNLFCIPCFDFIDSTNCL